MRRRRGRPANEQERRAAFEQYGGPSVERAGFATQRIFQQNAPVRFGVLSGSFFTGPLSWVGNRLGLTMGSDVAYAQAANIASTSVPPGYIERSLDEAGPVVEEEIALGIDAVTPHLWVDE